MGPFVRMVDYRVSGDNDNGVYSKKYNEYN